MLTSFVLLGLADVSDWRLVDITARSGGGILGDEDFRAHCIWCWNRKCDLVADSDRLRKKTGQQKLGLIGEHTGSRFFLPLDADHAFPANRNGRVEIRKSHAIGGHCRTALRKSKTWPQKTPESVNTGDRSRDGALTRNAALQQGSVPRLCEKDGRISGYGAQELARGEKYPGEALVDPAVAVEELLRGSKWCVVQFLGTLNQAEARAKLAVKRFGVITHHFESAAFRRTFRAKRADNDVAARLDSCERPAGRKQSVVLVSVRKWNTARSCQRSYARGSSSIFVISATSQRTCSAAEPNRLLVRSIAVCETSRTVMFLYPRRSRSSTSVDSPPPTSMMEAERASTARSISARDVSRCVRYQLTASGAFVV